MPLSPSLVPPLLSVEAFRYKLQVMDISGTRLLF